MSTSRRDFMKNVGLGFATAGLAMENLACAAATESGESASENLLVERPGQPEPAPIGYDRLPLDWYQATTQRLKEKVADLMEVSRIDYVCCKRPLNWEQTTSTLNTIQSSKLLNETAVR